MAAQEFIQTFLLATLVAVGPFLALTIYLARGKGDLWKGFFFGWLGWFLAFIVRVIPVQIPAVIYPGQIASSLFLTLLYLGYASAMAGVFEEGFRYFFLRLARAPERGWLYPLTFALGWGIGEALFIYVLNVALLPLVIQPLPSFVELLPGAIERNSAIVAHVAFTFLVMRSLASGKAFLGLAMALHFGLNIASVTALLLTQDPWITELLIGIMAVALFFGARSIRRKSAQMEGSPPPSVRERDGS